MKDKDLFAPPTKEELREEELFAAPTEEELGEDELFAAPTEEELREEELDGRENEADWEELKRIGKKVGVGVGGVAAQKLVADPLLKKLGSQVSEIGKDVYSSALSVGGELNKEQIRKILDEPELYKQLTNYNDLLDQYEEVIQRQKDTGIAAAEEGDKILKSSEVEIPKSKLKEKIKTAFDSPEYSFEPKKVNESLKQIPDLETFERAEPLKTASPQRQHTEDVAKFLKEEMKEIDKLNPQIKGKDLYTFSQKQKRNYQDSDLRNVMYHTGKDTIAESVPEAQKMYTKSKEHMDDLKKLKKISKLPMENIDTVKNQVHLPSTFKTRLKNYLKEPEKYKKELDAFSDFIEKYADKDLIKKTDLVLIKEAVEEVAKKGFDVGEAIKTGAYTKILLKMPGVARTAAVGSLLKGKYGTQTQEGLAKLPSSKLVKLGKGVGKLAWKSLPVVGGLLSYNEAKAAGYSDAEAAALTAGEEARDLLLGPAGMALTPSNIALQPGEEEYGVLDQVGSGSLDPKVATEYMEKVRSGEIEEKPLNIQEYQEDPVRSEKIPGAVEATESALKDIDKIKPNKDLNYLQGLMGKLDKYSQPATENYKQQLQELMSETDSKKRDRIEFNLQQQPAFKKFIEKAESEDE